MLMDVVPLLAPPPRFHFQVDNTDYTTDWQRESKSRLARLDHWLRQFYEEEGVDRLWSEHLPSHEQAAAALRQFSASVESTAKIFSEHTMSGTLEIVMMPNLLDMRNRGYSLSSDQRTWIFLGPVDDPADWEQLAVHEMLHRWVDPAAEETVLKNSAPDPMPQFRAQYPVVAQSYPDLNIVVGETVVRAATAWLMARLRTQPSRKTEESISHNEEIGFVGISDAYEHLVSRVEGSPSSALKEAVELVCRRVVGG